MGRRYNRYKLGGKSCIAIKYKNDTRYDDTMIVTHNGIKIEATPCTYLIEVDAKVRDFDVVCIDEVQFYKDAPQFCDKWANEGKIVVANGLSGTFNRTPFPIISELIPLAETIVVLNAICKKTGNDASFTKLLVENTTGGVEIIGGLDKYDAVDRRTYFN
jgi:thymidine kinase